MMWLNTVFSLLAYPLQCVMDWMFLMKLKCQYYIYHLCLSFGHVFCTLDHGPLHMLMSTFMYRLHWGAYLCLDENWQCHFLVFYQLWSIDCVTVCMSMNVLGVTLFLITCQVLASWVCNYCLGSSSVYFKHLHVRMTYSDMLCTLNIPLLSDERNYSKGVICSRLLVNCSY